jgi:hypothetical protein
MRIASLAAWPFALTEKVWQRSMVAEENVDVNAPSRSARAFRRETPDGCRRTSRTRSGDTRANGR